MKRFSLNALWCAFIAMSCSSCFFFGGKDDVDPVTDGSEAGAEVQSGESGTASSEGTAPVSSGAPTNPLANRMRLPDMTKLPTDKELAAKGDPNKGGGVIARPPSE